MPVSFAVPAEPGAVVSGLVLGDRALVRRTDFGEVAGPVEVRIGTRTVAVPAIPGKCQVVDLVPEQP